LQAGVPRRPEWLVDRPRLYAQLDAATAITRLTAPAGGGKTALLTGWAATAGDDILWVDAAHHRADLWPHVVALLDARAGETPPAAGAIDVADRSPGLVAVIDNADHVDPLDVDRLLDQLGSGVLLRIVVAGRDLRHFATARALMYHSHQVLSPPALDFTLDEMFALLRSAGVFGQDQTVQLLHSYAGGDPAVLRAAMVELASPTRPDPAGALERIIELVASTIVSDAIDPDADTELGQFLRDTCLAATLDRPFVRELSGVEQPDVLLDEAVRLGLGSWLDQGTYTYSGAARLVLRNAARRIDPERAHRLGTRAARWSREHGNSEHAFRLAIVNEDYETASRQLRDGFFELLLLSRDQTRVLLESVGRQPLLSQPLLAYHLALIYNADDERRPLAREHFQLVLQGLATSSSDSIADELYKRYMEGVCHRALGHPEQGIDSARHACGLVAELTESDERELGRSLPGAIAHCGLTLLHAGEYEDAFTAFAHAQALAPPFTAGRLVGLSMAAGAHALLGEIDEATAVVGKVRNRAWPEQLFAYGSTFLYLADALIALEAGDVEAARAAMTQAAHDEKRFTPNDHWELITYVEALTDIVDRRPMAAVERIAAARALRRGARTGGQLARGLLTATRATAEIAAGNPAAALATLDAARDTGDTGDSAPCTIARARALLAVDQSTDAIAVLDRLDDDRLTTRQRAERAAIDLAARLRLSTAHAAQDIDNVMAAISVHGLSTPLSFLPQSDLDTIGELAGPTTAATLDGMVVSVLQPASVVSLTPRELAVLRLLAETGSSSEIADALYVSVSTVKSQIQSIYRKLGVNSREEALAGASRVAPPKRTRRA